MMNTISILKKIEIKSISIEVNNFQLYPLVVGLPDQRKKNRRLPEDTSIQVPAIVGISSLFAPRFSFVFIDPTTASLLLRIPFFSLIDPRIHHRLRDESMCSLLDPSIVEEEVESVMVMVLMSMMKCSAANISRSNIFSLIP